MALHGPGMMTAVVVARSWEGTVKALRYSGLVLAIVCLSISDQAFAGGNVVMNPGFETGDFTDWSLSGNTEDTLVTDRNLAAKGAASYAPHSGNDYALLGPIGSLGSLSQTIATTAGQSYTFSWWLASDGDFENEFSASWNGSLILDQTGHPDAGLRAIHLHRAGDRQSTVIQFGFRDDPGYLSLDDVGVTAAVIGSGRPRACLVPAGRHRRDHRRRRCASDTVDRTSRRGEANRRRSGFRATPASPRGVRARGASGRPARHRRPPRGRRSSRRGSRPAGPR